jgi:hypothetical protein
MPVARKIIKRVEARYEVRQVPFGKIYEWNAAYVALQCDCGERLILTAASTTTACGRCGADLGGFGYDLQEHEGQQPDWLTHPWFYDAKERAEQHQQDEATYPEGSPWRYDDVTVDES